MDYTRLYVQIFDSIEHLTKVKASKSFWKPARSILLLNKREEVSLFDEFENYEKYLDCFAWWFDNELAFAIIVYKLDNIGVSDLF